MLFIQSFDILLMILTSVATMLLLSSVAYSFYLVKTERESPENS